MSIKLALHVAKLIIGKLNEKERAQNLAEHCIIS